MSGHLHCIAFREHYQLLCSLLHPAKVDQLYFVAGNMPSSTNWKKNAAKHLFGTGPWSLSTRGGGDLFINDDKEYMSVSE